MAGFGPRVYGLLGGLAGLAVLGAPAAAGAQDRAAQPEGNEGERAPQPAGLAGFWAVADAVPFTTASALESSSGLSSVAAYSAVATAGADAGQLPAKAVLLQKRSFWSLFTESTVKAQLRTRVEYADQKVVDRAIAYTARARVGVLTGQYKGFQAYIEYEHNDILDSKRSFQVVDGNPMKSIVADARSNRFHQAYLNFSTRLLDVKLGRQELLYGDQFPIGNKFIDNVDFRNNGNTFDTLMLTFRPTEKVELTYGYVYNINRLFGSKGDLDFDSRSNLVQARFHPSDALDIRGFSYRLDLQLQGNDPGSTNTTGVSLTGGLPLGPVIFGYRADYARQTDGGDSVADYAANYNYLRATATYKGITAGGGQEAFGDDNNVGVNNVIESTFRDIFITTPTNGLLDRFAFLSLPLPGQITAFIDYHKFRSYSGTEDYGTYSGIVLIKGFTPSLSLLGRTFTYRNADPDPLGGPLPDDTYKFSLQLDYRFN